MRRGWQALSLLALVSPSLAGEGTASRPDLDCTLGFEMLRASVLALPGAVIVNAEGNETVLAEQPDVWKSEIAVLPVGHPAHPAITLRTQIKQVTGVWTSQSKGCGFGDAAAFGQLMQDMKARDSELTKQSRDAADKANPAAPMGAAP